MLQFCENERPAYFGTFSKQSTFVGPRRPFGKDETILQYEYDSDEDWEEEEQGEKHKDFSSIIYSVHFCFQECIKTIFTQCLQLTFYLLYFL